METIYVQPSTIKRDKIIIHGAGKFQESKLILDKTSAAFLYIELHKFLELDKINKQKKK